MVFKELLNEICKVSTMKATNALSEFLNTPVAIEMKPIQIMHIDQINLFMDPNEKAVSLYLEINGDLKGASLLLWSQKSAHAMCDALFYKPKSDEGAAFRDEEIAALAEVANVVVGNFLTSFAQSLQLDKLMHRSAIFDSAEFGEIKQKLITELEKKMAEVVVDISFSFQHIYIKGFIIFIFEKESINDNLKKISVKSHL